MKEKDKRGIGLQYAWNGLKLAFIEERNLRIHVLAMVVVLLTSFYFKLNAIEWLFILFAIQTVIVTELINSTIERIIDYMKPEIHPKAKVIKDIAAGTVLIGALFSIVVGLVIFLPKLLKL